MYNYPGKTLRALAKALFWLSTVGAVILLCAGFVSLLKNGSNVTNCEMLISAPLLFVSGWLTGLGLSAVGDIVINTQEAADDLKAIKTHMIYDPPRRL